MKKAVFINDVFRDGAKVFAAGQAYPLDDETRKQIRRGNAAERDVEDETVEKQAPTTEELDAAAARVKANEITADQAVSELVEAHAISKKKAKSELEARLK